jgi:hypothetical protein
MIHPGIVAVLVKASQCFHCGKPATHCLSDEAGNLYPCCDECFKGAWPLFEVPSKIA